MDQLKDQCVCGRMIDLIQAATSMEDLGPWTIY